MKKLQHGFISAALTLLIGYLIYREVPDWGMAGRVMLQGRVSWLIAGFAFVMLHMAIRALRWGVLLEPVKSGISATNLFSLTLVKYVVNVIPPRAGEVAASVVLARKERIPAASVVASSVLERILDLLTVLVLFGFYLVFYAHRFVPSSDRGREVLLAIRLYSMYAAAAICLGFAVLAWLLRNPHWAGYVPVRIRRPVLSFLEGFRALQNRSTAIRVALLSVAIWLCITMQLWCLVQAYISFPIPGALLIVAMTAVGVAIPTPGGVGGFQFFMSFALVHFFSAWMSTRDPQSMAAGISNGCYIVSMVPVIAIGLLFLNREGLSLARISRMGRSRDEGGFEPWENETSAQSTETQPRNQAAP